MNSFVFRTKKMMSLVMVFLMCLSLFSPLINVSVGAEGDEDPLSPSSVEIVRYDTVFVSGASQVGGQYIWRPSQSNLKQRFVYRIDYAFSGTGDIEEGGIRITLPKHMIRDRSGEYADLFEASVPHVDEADADTDYAYYEGNDCIVITNHIPVTAAQDGYFEFSYENTKSTYEYEDMRINDDIVTTVSVCKQGEQAVTATDTAPGVIIDTSAEIKSTRKNVDYTRPYEWNSSFGERPADADDYYYLVWTVYTTFTETTQPFDFTIDDVFNEPDAEVVGYRMSGQTTFTPNGNTVHNIKNAVNYRYDFVLTRHLKATYPKTRKYTLNNKIISTVTPIDAADPQTKAESIASFVFIPAEYSAPIGSFWSEKYGAGQEINRNNRLYNYSLDDLRDGVVDYTESNLYYYCYVRGYTYPWTLSDGSGADDVDEYGKKNIRIVLEDEDFHFNGNSEKLTANDYEIRRINYSYSFNDAVFDEDELHFTSTAVNYKNDEALVIEAKFGDMTDFVKVGSYYFKSGRAVIEDGYSGYVSSLNDKGIVFSNTAKCTGYRLSTENAHYYSYISAYPYCRLKASPYILEKIGNYNKVYLTNTSVSSMYSGENTLFNRTTSADDIIIGIQRNTQITKKATSIVNNKVKKNVSVSWQISLMEEMKANDGTEKIEQQSGRFYDLLPLGCELSVSSVRVTGNGINIPSNSVKVSRIYNYRDTGRTMMIVDVKAPAEKYILYFSTVYSWENMKDYGFLLKNGAAYETGNANIGGGFPDNGGDIDEHKLMNDLDDSTNAKKFVYTQGSISLTGILTTATTGLSKKVMSKDDEVYSRKTIVRNSGDYSYRIRLATNAYSQAKNIVICDSLENYVNEGASSDWHGELVGVDVSQPVNMGLDPVVWYSDVDELDLYDQSNFCITVGSDSTGTVIESSYENAGGDRIWYTEEQFVERYGSIGSAKAVRIDLSRDKKGGAYTLDKNKSLIVILNMRAPDNDSSNSADPTAYNNIHAFNTTIGEFDNESNVYLYQNFTELHYRITGDFGIYKADSTDLEKPVEGIFFCLSGTSDYGTGVLMTKDTDSGGFISFTGVEKGEYDLYETDGSNDYQALKNPIKVVIDGNGKVTINGKTIDTDSSDVHTEGTFTDGYYTIPNDPRVHTDIEFTKSDISRKGRLVKGAKFKLWTESSGYGNNVLMYAESGDDGRVVFKNVELGSYSLIETEPAEGYIPNKTEYTVTVDASGNYSITGDGAELKNDGTYSIYNEPYHSFTIQKIDYTTGLSLGGAEFTLTSSDLETEVTITKTSSTVNGRLTFDGLESGTYILQETAAPEGYFKDDTPRIVVIKPDNTITIDGLETNDAGNFVIDNKKNGTVTITKKWEDDKANDERPVPVVHLSTTRNATRATFLGGRNVNSRPKADFRYFEYEAGQFESAFHRYAKSENGFTYVREITAFKPWAGELPEGITTFRMDDRTTASQILGWFDEGTLYWWSDAQEVYLAKNSWLFFYCLTGLTEVDMTGIITSKVTDMYYMFWGCSSLQSVDFSDMDLSNVVDMGYMFRGCSSLTSVSFNGSDASNLINTSSMFSSLYNLQSVDMNGFYTPKLKNMSYMFSNCNKLTSLDLSGMDTSNVTDMSGMFYYCTNLTSLDLSSWDTSNVRTMYYMFYSCRNLEAINLSRFDTSNVTSMYGMFGFCEKLTSLDLSSWDTSCVTDMNEMFLYCYKLTSLDLSSWDTSCVKNTSSMFNYCSRISVIKVSELWNMDAVTNSSDMFRSCSSLRGGQGTGYNSSFTDKTYARIDDRNNGNPGYFTEKAFTGTVVPVDRDYVNLTNAFINNTKNNSSAMSFMRFTGDYDDIQQLVEEGTAVRVDDTTRDKQAYIWYDTDNQIIYWWSDAEIAYLPYSCSQMFYGNSSLTSVDLVGLDSSRTSEMSYMFYNCSALTSINFSSLDTSYVTRMDYMFCNCSALKSIDLSGFDTSCVTRMDYMFRGCSRLTSLDLSGFDTSSVINMEYMFYGCSGLTSIDVSSFITSNAYNMGYIFYNCSSLTSIDVSSFDTSGTRSLCCLFYYCSSLTSIDVSNFDTSNVRDLGCLFCGCSSLVSLDVSSFNTSSAYAAYSIFARCTNLTTIYVSEGWNLYNKTLNDGDYTNVFNGSLKLVGEKGTRSADYDLGWERGIQYARIDDPENGHPGFLTYKAAGGYNGIHYISDTESADGVRMADGGETGGASCTIDKNAAENTWTYTFTGINDTVEYYVWEDVPEGYTGSATETNAGKVTEGRFTITNTSPNAPKYGDLKISKTLTAADGAALIDADYETQFVFTVLLTDENGEAVTGSRFFGNVPFVDGRAVIRIRSDRTSPEEDNGVTVTDIPEGWHYTVTEATAEGFILTAHTGDEGVIDADSVKAAVFNNAKQKEPEPVPTVNVTLTKTVQGVFDETEDSFEFMASITGLKPRETYIYTRNGDEVEYTSDRTGSADLRLSLSSGDVIIFEELPVNSVYRFIEQAGDYIASYVVTDSNGLDKIASTKDANLEENQALSTAAETADENENVTVSFLNRIIKTQDLTLKKLVRPSSDSNNDPFSFTFEIEGLDPESVIETDVGQMRADSNGAIEAHFTMKDGQTVMIYGLPIRSKYRITEAASSYIASYVINDSNNLGRILRSSDDNGTETDKALSTQLETVDQGEEAEITFINTKLSHDITVSKKLDMTYGDTTSFNYKAQRFLFKVVFSGLTVGRAYTLSRTSEDMIGSIDDSFTADSTNYEYRFELRDGEALTFRDLEENVLYTVTELYDENDPVLRRCIPSYEIKSNSEAVTAKLTDSLNEAGELSTATETVDHTDYDVNIIFTNRYIFTPYVLPNSGFKDVRPVLIFAGAGIILFAIMFAASRNHKRKKAS